MRIALVTTLYEPFEQGGAGRSVRDLAEDLAGRGHAVQVHTLGPEDHPADEQIGGVAVRRLREPDLFGPFAPAPPSQSSVRKAAWHAGEAFRPRAHRFLANAFAEFRPDVVHTNSIAGFGLAAWSAAAVPLVHTLRDYYLGCVRSRLYRDGRVCETRCRSCRTLKAPVRLQRRRPDHWVGISHDIVARHRRLGLIHPADRTAVVPNWPRFERAVRSVDVGGRVRFGLLGRVGEDKGTWVAVEAFRRLTDEAPGTATLTVAGGASAEEQQRLAELERAAPGLRYIGHVDAPSFFREVDVSLVPSQWYEPFGRVAAESRLAGADVIASAAGGLPEVVRRFGGTTVRDFQDPAAWLDAMRSSLAGGRAAPDRAMLDGDSSDVADRYLELYAALQR